MKVAGVLLMAFALSLGLYAAIDGVSVFQHLNRDTDTAMEELTIGIASGQNDAIPLIASTDF